MAIAAVISLITDTLPFACLCVFSHERAQVKKYITKHSSTWMAHVPRHRVHTFEKSHFLPLSPPPVDMHVCQKCG